MDAVGALHSDVKGSVEAVRPAPVLLTAVTCGGALLAAWKGYRTVRSNIPKDGKIPNPFRLAAAQLLALLLPSLALSFAQHLAPGAGHAAGGSSRSAPGVPVFGRILPRGFYRWLGLEK